MKTINLYEKDFKITNSNEEPSNINLDAYPLYKERIFWNPGTANNGRLREINHWKEYNSETNQFSDLVVKEEFEYTDTNGLLALKIIHVHFYNVNNEIGVTQTKTKAFVGENGILESIELGEERRRYLIKKGKAYLYSSLGIENGIILFSQLRTEIEDYIGVNNQTQLFTAVTNNEMLTTEQKNTLLYILTYS
jgi:hypothetical protein